jgi:serine/threonine protein kinase
MISNEFPFGKHATNWNQLIDSIKFELPDPLDVCSPSLNDLVLKMIQKSPKKRPFAISCFQHPWFSEFGHIKSKKNSSPM